MTVCIIYTLLRKKLGVREANYIPTFTELRIGTHRFNGFSGLRPEAPFYECFLSLSLSAPFLTIILDPAAGLGQLLQ